MKLRNRVALVTGGSQGIGEESAVLLAREGAAVAVLASSSIEKAERVVSRITSQGGRAQAYVADVSDHNQLASIVTRIGTELGVIDILVNCAGVFYPTSAGVTDDAGFDRIIATNLKGTWNPINIVAPEMKARGFGKIINIASVAGLMGIANYGLYCASKAGVIALTRSLACELAPFGINVNCIAPGNTATPMNSDIRNKPEFKEYLERMTARTPSGRTYSSADDIAGAVVFLASDSGRAMHGSCMLMDEGFSAGL